MIKQIEEELIEENRYLQKLRYKINDMSYSFIDRSEKMTKFSAELNLHLAYICPYTTMLHAKDDYDD